MRNNAKLIAAVFLIAGLLIFLLLFACKPSEDQFEFAGTTNFDDVTVTGAVTGADLTASDDVTVGDDLTVTDDSTLTDDVDIGGTLNFGANDLYPVGYASDGEQLVVGTTSITGTATAAHGLTTVTFCLCSLGSDPDDDAGDVAMCTTAVSANVCTLKTWQDDFVTAATEIDIPVHWLVVGTP
jgi:hypothetical protein